MYGALCHTHLPTLPFELSSVLYTYIVHSVTLTPTRPSRPAPPTEAPSHCLDGSNCCLGNRNRGRDCCWLLHQLSAHQLLALSQQ